MNAGGVINVYAELTDNSAAWALQKAEGIYDTIYEIIARSANENIPAYAIANKVAEERIAAVGKVKLSS